MAVIPHFSKGGSVWNRLRGRLNLEPYGIYDLEEEENEESDIEDEVERGAPAEDEDDEGSAPEEDADEEDDEE